MKLLDLFKKKKSQRDSNNIESKVLAELDPSRGIFSPTACLLIVSIRQTAILRGMPLTWETTNTEVLNMCEAVFQAFTAAEIQRSEQLDDAALRGLVLFLLGAYLTLPHDFFYEHVKYEANKYAQSGLREDYIEFAHRRFGPAWDSLPMRLMFTCIDKGQ
jgi:hypothetical protein